MIRRRTLALPALATALLAITALLPACGSGPECASGDHGGAECRVATSTELARTEVDGYQLAFGAGAEAPPYAHTDTGLFRRDGGSIVAQVATPGDFLITVDGSGATDATTLSLVLANVGPTAAVHAEPDQHPEDRVAIPGPPDELLRSVALDLIPGETWTIRGTTPCPQRFRLAVLGDIQHGVDVFEQITARLNEEQADAVAAGEPLLGLLLVGDLADEATVDELVVIRELVEAGSVPLAATPGNHDTSSEDVDVFNREIGPGNLRFDLCQTRVVLLDTANAGLAPSIEARLPALLDPAGADQLLVGMHYPPYSSRLGNGWSHEDQQARVLAEIAAAGADMTFAGHVHNLTEFTEVPVGDTTLHQVISGTGGGGQGDVVEPRYGYLRVTLGGDEVERCFVPVALPGADPPAPQREDEPPLCP